MSFRWAGRIDDDLRWTWDESDDAIFDDTFQKVIPHRLPRGADSARLETRTSAGTIWSINSGASWDAGDLLKLKDPDNSDFSLLEITLGDKLIGVAAHDVTSGVAPGPDPDYAVVWNTTSTALFETTDINETTPTASHVGNQASLTQDGSNEWFIDVSGSGDVKIEKIDTVREVFIIRFLEAVRQDNPHD